MFILKKGNSLLHLASMNGNYENVKILLSNGFDMTAKNMFGNNHLKIKSDNNILKNIYYHIILTNYAINQFFIVTFR